MLFISLGKYFVLLGKVTYSLGIIPGNFSSFYFLNWTFRRIRVGFEMMRLISLNCSSELEYLEEVYFSLSIMGLLIVLRPFPWTEVLRESLLYPQHRKEYYLFLEIFPWTEVLWGNLLFSRHKREYWFLLKLFPWTEV